MNGELQRLRLKVKEFFTSDDRFVFEKDLATGTSGFGILFKETDKKGSSRRFVVKRSVEEEWDADIQNELNWLQKMQYVKHIVNLVTVTNNPILPQNGQGGLGGVSIIMEYMENGTIRQFLDRASGETLPNRLLWAIFLCLIRACTGMAYPPPRPDDDGNLPAEIPLEGVIPSTLAHRDMHDGNLMFDCLDPKHREHSLVPVVKLIDFDRATLMPDQVVAPKDNEIASFDGLLNLSQLRSPYGVRNTGIDENIISAGIVMTRIITNSKSLPLPLYREQIRDPNIFPSLDNDLRLLILRCLAVDPENRPRLEELLTQLHEGLSTKTQAYYANNKAMADRERDETISEIVSKFILNGNTTVS
ncbi:kinase-like domain-containing protein [Biscogniauxia mediterranea]|nr:kinase-like domain-containing protein [Biscogniauxia mediterranea]